MNTEVIDIKTIGSDGKGSLSFYEAQRTVPFPIRRVYYTYGVEAGIERGAHAHRDLWQLLVCPNGCVEVLLEDESHRWSERLDRPDKGLVIGPYVWHSMVWRTEGAVLLVSASDWYDEGDYIRDYDTFRREVCAYVARTAEPGA